METYRRGTTTTSVGALAHPVNRGVATTTGEAAGGWLNTIVPWMFTFEGGAGGSQSLMTRTWKTFGVRICTVGGLMPARLAPGRRRLVDRARAGPDEQFLGTAGGRKLQHRRERRERPRWQLLCCGPQPQINGFAVDGHMERRALRRGPVHDLRDAQGRARRLAHRRFDDDRLCRRFGFGPWPAVRHRGACSSAQVSSGPRPRSWYRLRGQHTWLQ
jgi:hypothetical protein